MKKNQSLNRKPECNGSPGKALGFKNVISAFAIFVLDLLFAVFYFSLNSVYQISLMQLEKNLLHYRVSKKNYTEIKVIIKILLIQQIFLEIKQMVLT